MQVISTGDLTITLMPDDEDNPSSDVLLSERNLPYIGVRGEGDDQEYVLVVRSEVYDEDGNMIENGCLCVTLTEGINSYTSGVAMDFDPSEWNVFKGTMIINAGEE